METVELARVLRAPAAVVYSAFVDGTVFRLTGADRIEAEPRVDGTFSLDFSGRGSIRGSFLELEAEARVRLSWVVTGFGRPLERSLVEIELAEDLAPRRVGCTPSGGVQHPGTQDGTRLVLRHTAIASAESREAKERAWRSILDDLESALG